MLGRFKYCALFDVPKKIHSQCKKKCGQNTCAHSRDAVWCRVLSRGGIKFRQVALEWDQPWLEVNLKLYPTVLHASQGCMLKCLTDRHPQLIHNGQVKLYHCTDIHKNTKTNLERTKHSIEGLQDKVCAWFCPAPWFPFCTVQYGGKTTEQAIILDSLHNRTSDFTQVYVLIFLFYFFLILFITLYHWNT